MMGPYKRHGIAHWALRIAGILVIGFLILLLILLVYCLSHVTKDLAVTHYSIETGLAQPIRIVQLSDLHNAEFGEHNSELIRLVKEQQPDLIVMTGDMINKKDEDIGIVCDLIKDLSQAADVYYSFGNHETAWISSFGGSIEEALTEAGAIVLNNNYLDVCINHNSIRLGGYMGYYGAVQMTAHSEQERQEDLSFMDEFEDTDRYKILLNHIPTSWVDWDYLDLYPVDLVFSGHYHGGIARLPVMDCGLYAPYVGWFPKNIHGVFTGELGTCVLSAGIGSEYPVPRINNPPEIVVVDLIPQEAV